MTATGYAVMFTVFAVVVLPGLAVWVLRPDRTLRVHRRYCPGCERDWVSTERRCPRCAQLPPTEPRRPARHVLRADRRVQETR